jgi:hypothetical protein
MPHKPASALTKDNRDDLAVRLIVFLSGRQDDLERFLSASGMVPGELRSNICDVGFQQGLLDYVMSNEPLLLAFCEETGDDPADIARLTQLDQMSAQQSMQDWS